MSVTGARRVIRGHGKIAGAYRQSARVSLSFARQDQGREPRQMSKLEHPKPEGLLPNPAYSHVVAASGKRMIYTAGQVSIDERGALVGAGDLAAQTTQVMRNLGLALAAAGASYADVVKITTYVVNYKPEDRAIVGKARASFFANGTPPASTLVGVAALALPEWLVEIEAVAIVD
jgi:enamine deaminase RidA (YjgF/YER057c/UK114 family)